MEAMSNPFPNPVFWACRAFPLKPLQIKGIALGGSQRAPKPLYPLTGTDRHRGRERGTCSISHIVEQLSTSYPQVIMSSRHAVIYQIVIKEMSTRLNGARMFHVKRCARIGEGRLSTRPTCLRFNYLRFND